MKKYTIPVIIVLGVVGLVDALYLAYGRYMHVDLPCKITGGGCATVAASPYAVLFGMPLAYLGVLFYISIVALSLLYIVYKHVYIKKVLIAAMVFGALDSLYFMYVQGFIIKAFCVYCIISAITTFILLIPAYLLYITEDDEDAEVDDKQKSNSKTS